MAGPLRQIHDQMLEPKWVIAMGACASSGGIFSNYSTEALLEGVTRLHEKIRAGISPAYELAGSRHG